MTRTIVEQRVFAASVESIFDLLIKPTAICQWWNAKQAIVLAETGGYWSAVWGEDVDDPEYVTIATIVVFEPPRRLVLGDYRYRAQSGGLPYEADFVSEFTLTDSTDGTILQVEQHGFPDDAIADDHFASCVEGWRRTFDGISEYLKTRR